MMKRTTVLTNSFRKKSGVHSVMSPRQIIFGKKFKALLCKMGELVLVYDVPSNNKTSKPKAFYTLYIRPNTREMRVALVLKIRHLKKQENSINY